MGNTDTGKLSWAKAASGIAIITTLATIAYGNGRIVGELETAKRDIRDLSERLTRYEQGQQKIYESMSRIEVSVARLESFNTKHVP